MVVLVGVFTSIELAELDLREIQSLISDRLQFICLTLTMLGLNATGSWEFMEENPMSVLMTEKIIGLEFLHALLPREPNVQELK